MTKNKKSRVGGVSLNPVHEKLPWPGLRANDHLSRVVARALKEAKETRECEAWAEKQIERVLEHVSPDTALKLIRIAMNRRAAKDGRT